MFNSSYHHCGYSWGSFVVVQSLSHVQVFATRVVLDFVYFMS